MKLPLISDSKAYNNEQDEDENGMTLGSPDRKLYMIDDRINSLLYSQSAQKPAEEGTIPTQMLSKRTPMTSLKKPHGIS